MIDKIETFMIAIAEAMNVEKCSEIQHTVELYGGNKYKFHIKKLKDKKVR